MRQQSIAIIGGGPSALFLLKHLVESGNSSIEIDIFESQSKLGTGMPYSTRGSNVEHVTNVSGNEIALIEQPLAEWLKTVPAEILNSFNLKLDASIEFKVVPRLLFGHYLHSQFEALIRKAKQKEISIAIHFDSTVTDIIDRQEEDKVYLYVGAIEKIFSHVIVCTGHAWPKTHEGKVEGYFDSPYPPVKLKRHSNHPVAIRGSSLTAIDAIRTLARYNGKFIQKAPHLLEYVCDPEAPEFRIVMHSRNGLLPGIRFHLSDPLLSKEALLSKEELRAHINENGGFLSLDFIFEKDFKESFRDKDARFYTFIKDMSLETFVETMMEYRKAKDPFILFREEYADAMASIRNKESIYWKEMLAVLSFALNYPAKYLSAEDMIRLQTVLMPLISVVIAFTPQSSCEELIALHDAGRLEIKSVGHDSKITVLPDGGIEYHITNEENVEEVNVYHTFIDCVGQRHLSMEDLPFEGLVKNNVLSQAILKFRTAEAGALVEKSNERVIKTSTGEYYLKVPGVAISDTFRIITPDGNEHRRLHLMAVPYIGGYNPDYSGLDFCEQASKIIAEDIIKKYDVVHLTH